MPFFPSPTSLLVLVVVQALGVLEPGGDGEGFAGEGLRVQLFVVQARVAVKQSHAAVAEATLIVDCGRRILEI